MYYKSIINVYAIRRALEALFRLGGYSIHVFIKIQIDVHSVIFSLYKLRDKLETVGIVFKSRKFRAFDQPGVSPREGAPTATQESKSVMMGLPALSSIIFHGLISSWTSPNE